MDKLIERFERSNRNKPWRWFSMTRRGRMSWADWFAIRAHEVRTKETSSGDD